MTKFDVAPSSSDPLLNLFMAGAFADDSTREQRNSAVKDLEIIAVLEKEGPMTFEEFMENRRKFTPKREDEGESRRALRRLVEAGKVIVIEDE